MVNLGGGPYWLILVTLHRSTPWWQIFTTWPWGTPWWLIRVTFRNAPGSVFGNLLQEHPLVANFGIFTQEHPLVPYLRRSPWWLIS